MAGIINPAIFAKHRGVFFKMFIRSHAAILLLGSVTAVAWAQFGPPPPGPPPLPRAGAPVDLTGYWVSLVTEDWRARMTAPPKCDAGTQTRTFYFGAPQGQGGDWQGISVASWDVPGTIMTRGSFGLGNPGGPERGGALKVVTTKMKAGYLRRNGIPYSENAVITEYYDRFDIPNGDSLLLVTTEVNDPIYLSAPFWTSTHFKKQTDSAGWNPSVCSAR